MLFLFVYAVNLSAAPLYRAGETNVKEQDFLRWEVSAGGVFSSLSLQDAYGQNVQNGAKGFNLRALYVLSPYIGVGIEGTHFSSRNIATWIDKYQTDRVGALVKFSLAPEVSPRVYALLGAGISRYRLEYRKSAPTLHWKNTNTHIPYALFALGLEKDFWRSCFIGLEGNLAYHKRTHISTYYRLEKRWETAAHIRAGVRF